MNRYLHIKQFEVGEISVSSLVVSHVVTVNSFICQRGLSLL